MSLYLVNLEKRNREYKRKLLEEAMQVVTDLRDYRAQKAFQQAYAKNLEAEERLVDRDRYWTEG